MLSSVVRCAAAVLRACAHPARQRLPLLPVLLAARARQIEHRVAVARAVHVDLRVAQVRDQRKVELLQELVELARGARARVDAHRDERDRRALPRARACTRRSPARKSAGRRHVEHRRRHRHDHRVGAAHRVAQRVAARAARRCRRPATRAPTSLHLLLARVAREARDRRKQRRAGAPATASTSPADRRPASPTRWRLPASQPAMLVASVVLPLPPFGFATRIVCTTHPRRVLAVYVNAATATAASRTAPSAYRRPAGVTARRSSRARGSGRSALSLNGISSVSASPP